MSLKSTFSTSLDVRNMSEYITTEVRDNARIMQYIYRADSIVREGLRSLYSIDAGLLDTAPYNGVPQNPFAVPDQGITANSSDGALSDLTPASTAVTELWTFTFTSGAAFTASGSVSGAQGSGNTGAEFTSTNSYITIPTANWSGTFAANDVVYCAVYAAYPLIVSISTFLAAGLMLKAANEGIDEISSKGTDFWDTGMDLLRRLQNPNDDDGITLASSSSPTYSQDITPEGVNYAIDALGRDISWYNDNENTKWNDSTEGGSSLFSFFIGPVWY